MSDNYAVFTSWLAARGGQSSLNDFNTHFEGDFEGGRKYMMAPGEAVKKMTDAGLVEIRDRRIFLLKQPVADEDLVDIDEDGTVTPPGKYEYSKFANDLIVSMVVHNDIVFVATHRQVLYLDDDIQALVPLRFAELREESAEPVESDWSDWEKFKKEAWKYVKAHEPSPAAFDMLYGSVMRAELIASTVIYLDDSVHNMNSQLKIVE